MLGRGKVLKSLHLHFFRFLPLKGIEDVSYTTNPGKIHPKTDTGFPEKENHIKATPQRVYIFF